MREAKEEDRQRKQGMEREEKEKEGKKRVKNHLICTQGTHQKVIIITRSENESISISDGYSLNAP